jgi:predicted  nucleic acid-binding Zn-ribbon protein
MRLVAPVHNDSMLWYFAVMAEPDNIVLEHLRHIRGAIDGVRDDIREMKQRIGSLENQYANISNRLDRMDMRIERIERRLDLTDA